MMVEVEPGAIVMPTITWKHNCYFCQRPINGGIPTPEFLIFPIFSNICYQNVDFRVTNGDENRFIMA
jgi:hypothetical protein